MSCNYSVGKKFKCVLILNEYLLLTMTNNIIIIYYLSVNMYRGISTLSSDSGNRLFLYFHFIISRKDAMNKEFTQILMHHYATATMCCVHIMHFIQIIETNRLNIMKEAKNQ